MFRPVKLIVFVLLLLPLQLKAGAGTYNSFEEALNEPEKVIVLKIVLKQLQNLPDIFDQFPNLEEINFSHNRITVLPPSLFTCKKLRKIILFRNRIENLPDGLGNLE